MNNNTTFYVYAYLNPLESGRFGYDDFIFHRRPFYVGKGLGRRATEHIRLLGKCKHNMHKQNLIKKIMRETGSLPTIIKLRENLSEVDAFTLEKRLIELIGRVDLGTGCLLNLTNGGDGSSEMSPITREMIRARMLGERNPNYGGKVISEKHVSNLKLSGSENYFFGKTHSDQAKNKICETRRCESEQTKQKRLQSFRETRLRNPEKFCSRYELISPSGELHVVDCGLDKFCTLYNLSSTALRLMLRDSTYSPQKGTTVGWKIKKLQRYKAISVNEG